MEDSGKKPGTSVDAQNPPGTSIVVVKNPVAKDGSVTYREVLKDEHGKFIKKVKPLPATIEFVRSRRKRLLQPNADGVTADMQIMNELLQIINTPIECDRQGLPDAKFAMAKVKAAETVWLYTLGKPSPSEQEMDLLKHNGVKIVIVQPPDLMHSEITEEIKEEKTQPSFADVLSIKTNK